MSSTSGTGRVGGAAGALLAALLGLFAVLAAEDASAAATFVPAPCPDMTWRIEDPAFEALAGATAYSGEYAGGLYKIEIPDDWNGGLILYAHGFRSTAGADGDLLRAPTFTNAQWRESVIRQGYAWAASSYRCNGYVPGIGLQDTILLLDVFDDVNGGDGPDRTYLTGTSMGGHVTLLGAHEYPTLFDGYLAMCPAGPALFDYFAAMGAAAEVITSIQFSASEPAATTLQRMFEITGTSPANFTQKGLEMASVMINSSGGPRPFAFQGLNPWFSQTISGAKLAGATDLRARAASTEEWVYSIDAGLPTSAESLSSMVRRAAGDESVRGDETPYNELKPFSGEIARPLLTLHTTGDMYVPIFLERELKTAVDEAGNSNLLVQRIIRATGHCEFSGDEIVAAFDALAGWVEERVKPEGDDVMADLSDAGLAFTTPLRTGDPGTKSVSREMYDAAAPSPSPTPTAPPATATPSPSPSATVTPVAPRPPNAGTGAGTDTGSLPGIAFGIAMLVAASMLAVAARRR